MGNFYAVGYSVRPCQHSAFMWASRN